MTADSVCLPCARHYDKCFKKIIFPFCLLSQPYEVRVFIPFSYMKNLEAQRLCYLFHIMEPVCGGVGALTQISRSPLEFLFLFRYPLHQEASSASVLSCLYSPAHHTLSVLVHLGCLQYSDIGCMFISGTHLFLIVLEAGNVQNCILLSVRASFPGFTDGYLFTVGMVEGALDLWSL